MNATKTSNHPNHIGRIACSLILAAGVLFTTTPAQAASRDGGELILLVGNSFVRGVSRPLQDLYRSVGKNVSVKTISRSRWTLDRHAHSRRSLRKLAAYPWDQVVLQEQSAGMFPARYPAARDLDTMIHEIGAQTTFYMTWRDRNDSIAMYDSLRGAPDDSYGYVPIAFELGAPVAPIGWAVRSLVEDGKPVDVWSYDGHHLNEYGHYLAACVLFATLTQTSPVGLEAPSRFTPAEALYLQELAEGTVLTNPGEWNIGN